MGTVGSTELMIVGLILLLLAAVVVSALIFAVRLARRSSGHIRPPDLAGRARALKASGHQEQAVSLVRGETGMSSTDATRFVELL